MFNSINDVIKGIYLLVLAISGNFIAETLGCKTQKLLTENMYAKHIIIILILYFSIGFTTSDNDNPIHPMTIFKMTIIIYILFLFFIKLNLYFTIIVFTLLTLCYINLTFIDYYKKTDSDNKNLILYHEKIQKILYILIPIFIFIGFTLYFKKQYNDHYDNWSILLFFFGIVKCKSLKNN